MIFVDYSLSDWLEKYPDLKVLKLECDSCGNVMVADKPFVEKGYAGITSGPCKCGKNKHICVSKVTTSMDSHNHWMSLIENYL